ncbi:MAG: tetratricopeptide repeat protein [Candidatus Methanodesulfokora sp.]
MGGESAEVYYNRGVTFINYRKYEDAVEALSKAIELEPDLARAYYNRGIAFLNLNKFDEALRDFDKAWSMREKLFSMGAEVVSAVLKAISANPELKKEAPTWIDRAKEVYDLLSDEVKGLVEQLKA